MTGLLISALPPHMRYVIENGKEATNFNVRLAMSPEELKSRAEQRMFDMDTWPRELRLLAHEYGHVTVQGFMRRGVYHAPTIERTILDWRNQRDLRYTLLDLDLEF